jgi:hypothetical protein
MNSNYSFIPHALHGIGWFLNTFKLPQCLQGFGDLKSSACSVESAL